MSLENIFHPAELFDNLLRYLDCSSIINLLYSSDVLYNRYAHDEYTLKKIINQIFKELQIDLTVHELFDKSEYREQRLYFHDLLSVHGYFINFNNFGLNNIVCFLVDRNKTYYTSIMLFDQLLTKINTHMTNPRFRNTHGLDYSQISEIIANCDEKQLITVFEQMIIPKNIICTSIKTMLNLKPIDMAKLKQCIRYFLIKNSFGNRNRNLDSSYFLTDILSEIIITNNKPIMQYILEKRTYTKTHFDYSFLVSKCLEFDRIDMLDTIYSDNHDMFKNSNNKPLFITGNMISDIVKRGSFLTLRWIIKNLLGRMINLNVYITAIASSIAMCKKTDDLHYLFFLDSYLTTFSKRSINNSLHFIYYKYNFPFYQRVFFNDTE